MILMGKQNGLERQLAAQLGDLGVETGCLLMVHSSFRSLGVEDPEAAVQALLQAVGEEGTLLMPALTYMQKPAHVHDTRTTPSCVGYLTEYFRTRPGTLRSLHPTHSVCAVGPAAEALLEMHILDKTPCGLNSPFNQLLHQKGKILMLGCGLMPNTSMHAIEEYARPPYLFGEPNIYTITDEAGDTLRKAYFPHSFQGIFQRYDRVGEILTAPALRSGKVGAANCHLIEAETLFQAALEKFKEDPFYFVERVGEQAA
jgi:aminoglycoside 3-N-acetyltransferase